MFLTYITLDSLCYSGVALLSVFVVVRKHMPHSRQADEWIVP